MKNGFTLVELLIVLAIIGILGAISYPIYTAHILRAHRTEAKVNLLDLAARLEQYYLVNNNYKNATLTNLNFYKPEKYYRYEIKAEENEYVIYAKPIGPQAEDACGTLSYNFLGGKQAAIHSCW